MKWILVCVAFLTLFACMSDAVDPFAGTSDVSSSASANATDGTIRHTVTFNPQLWGLGVLTQSVADGGFAVRPGNPPCADKEFLGWYAEPACLTPWDFATGVVRGDMELYAKWGVSGAGSSSSASQSVSSSAASSMSGSLSSTENSSSSTAWSTGNSSFGPSSTSVPVSSSAASSSSSVVSSVGSVSSSSASVASSFSSSSLPESSSSSSAETEHTVKFNTAGGSSIDNQTVAHGGLVTLPAVPTKYGYAFAYWCRDSAGLIPWNFAADTVMAGTELYARWLVATPGLEYALTGDVYSVKKGTAVTDGTVTIPEYWAGKKVTVVASEAFTGCGTMTSVVLPAGITSIESYGFYGCSGLTGITLPAQLKSIKDYAFYNCTGLTSVVIPASVTSLGDYIFQNCSKLASFSLPGGILNSGSYTFANCVLLKNVVIPEGMTALGACVFSGCTGLTNASLPSGLLSIGVYSFAGCTSLKTIVIPGTVVTVGNYAFNGCSAMVTATIGGKVEAIGDYAFSMCPSLASITLPGSVKAIGVHSFYNYKSGITLKWFYINAFSPPTLGSEAFCSVTDGFYIKVLAGRESVYKAAAGWSLYKDCITPQ